MKVVSNLSFTTISMKSTVPLGRVNKVILKILHIHSVASLLSVPIREILIKCYDHLGGCSLCLINMSLKIFNRD